jgi:hypothetical protein
MLAGGGPFSHDELVGLLADIPEELSAAKRPLRDIPIVTLEPDGEGSYFAVRPDDETNQRAGSVAGRPSVDNRTVVFPLHAVADAKARGGVRFKGAAVMHPSAGGHLNSMMRNGTEKWIDREVRILRQVTAR